MLTLTVIIALHVAFIVLFISRFEVREGVSIREWMQARVPGKIAEMLRCDFCLCWWMCLVFSACAVCFVGWGALLVAIPATPIARFLL